MTTHSIKTVWEKNRAFTTDLDGHKVTIDLSEEQGGHNKGPRPKKMMLVAATGCTGLDVVETLKRMRVEIDDFNIHIDAELADTHPKQYTSMKLIYHFKGKALSEKKIKRAVQLSFDKYCGVLTMYQQCIPVSYEVKIDNL